MWHHHHGDYKDVLFARQLLYSVEKSGKKTFPDYKTSWHFNDKVGQKYLFEAINAPLVPSYVFYTKKSALEWINNTSFPKVFKLRGGAGSEHVRMVRSAAQAKKIVTTAFNKGFAQFNRVGYLKERFRRYREGKDTYIGVMKGIGRLFLSTEYAHMQNHEKGYVYFQDYIPYNSCDIRVIVVNKKAFAIKRLVRTNDFRASGSGNILYERNNFPLSTIELAFTLTDKIKSQCAAYDFVYDADNNPLVVEVSYGFSHTGYEPCVGYWDTTLEFHEGSFNPLHWMVEMMMMDA